jgi:hypothetical protein
MRQPNEMRVRSFDGTRFMCEMPISAACHAYSSNPQRAQRLREEIFLRGMVSVRCQGRVYTLRSVD